MKGKIIIIISSLFLFFSLPKLVYAWSRTDKPVFIKSVYNKEDDYVLGFTADMAFLSDGSYYVIKYQDIFHFSSEHKIINCWSNEKIGTISSWTILGVYTDESYVYIADNQNISIHKFALSGEYIESLTSQDLTSPEEVVIDSQGRYYVMDWVSSQSYTIKVFDSDFNFTGTTFHPAGGYFQNPWSMKFDNNNYIWVADTGSRKIRAYSIQEGNYGSEVLAYGSSGSALGQFNAPGDIAFTNGFLYVTEVLYNKRIQKFSYSGNPADSITPIEVWDSGQTNAYTMAADNSEYIYAAENDKLKIYDIQGNITKVLGSSSENGVIDSPYGIERNINGYNYIAERYNHRVQVFDSNFNFLFNFGSEGSLSGEFNQPTVVRSDSDGNIYIMDTGNNRAQKFDAQGNVMSWTGADIQDGSFSIPHALEVKGDRLYISEYGNNRVQVFDLEGNRLLQFGGSGGGNGLFNRPYGVAVDADGNMYVTDCKNNLIQKFDSGGNFSLQWGGSGTGDGKFNCPVGVRVFQDTIFVAERHGDRVQAFDLDGNFLHKFGSFGIYAYEFNEPRDLEAEVIGGNIYLFVSDSINDRIQVFAYDRTSPKVEVVNTRYEGEYLVIEGMVRDELSPVREVKVSVNGQEYMCESSDGSFDQLEEEFICLVDRESSSGEFAFTFSDSFTNEAQEVLGITLPQTGKKTRLVFVYSVMFVSSLVALGVRRGLNVVNK